MHAGILFFTTFSVVLSAVGMLSSWFFAAQSVLLLLAKAWITLYRTAILPRIRGASADFENGSVQRAQRVPDNNPHWTEAPAQAFFYALTVAPSALISLPSYQVGLDMILPLLGR
jgi:hypothetical protein